MTNNYIVATIKDWNIKEFDRVLSDSPGNWTLINDHNQLTLDNLRLLKPKYIFFPHWSWLVPEEILNEFTCICFHMTDVPYGRGGSPLQNLISRGHQTTKLTALKMTKQLDAGDVYLKAPLSLEGSAQEIFERCAKLTFDMIKSIITIEPMPIAQTGNITTFTRRKPEQSKIQGSETLTELYDLIRMMDADSYPKAFLAYGDFTLTFEQAKLTPSPKKEAPILNANVIITKRMTNLSEKIMTHKFITINGTNIGPDFPPYIIAELSANHNGKIEQALKSIEVAAQCGVDAIKIQSYTPDTMTINCDEDDFQIKGGLWHGYKLYDLYQWAQTPFEWHKQLFDKAKEVGITLFSTPFDESAVELLESLDAPAYKLASFEITDLPLIKRIAQTGKPLIISTGMANMEEIEEAITTAKENGCTELVVLHCISAYPAPVEQANLATIADISQRFDVISGLSDHSLGTVASVTSIALGASLIEKHFTLDRNDKGPDAEFSLEPEEFKRLVKETKEAYQAIGSAGYERKLVEHASMKFRRSLYFVNDIKHDQIITEEHIRRIRPGYGLAPKHYQALLGKRVNKDIKRGTAVSWDYIVNEEKNDG